MEELTRQEELAIELLKKAARHWPGSLWLIIAGDSLWVMREDKAGSRAMDSTRYDGHAVAEIKIPSEDR